MNKQQKISELKQELAKYESVEEKRKERSKEDQEIRDLKKKIREKKYAGVKRTGKNLKIIGKNVGKIMGDVGKGLDKATKNIGKNDPKKPQNRSVSEIINSLPQ